MRPIRSPGRGRPRGNALLFRRLDEGKPTEGLIEPTSFLDDKRFDSITERVIAHMDSRDVSEWESYHWAMFKAIWADRKSRKTQQGSVQEMTEEQLREIMTSSDEN